MKPLTRSRAQVKRVLGIFTPFIAVAMVAGWAAAPAMAASTVQITIETAPPEQAIPVQIALSGTIVSSGSGNDGSNVYAEVRPAGGVACQPTYEADRTAAGNDSDVIYNNFVDTGPLAASGNYDPDAPGSYLVCAWIEPSDNTASTTASMVFAARGPQVPVLTVALPVTPRPAQAFSITYTTQTDQQLSLSSVIKPAGGAPCASSYELERQQDADNEAVTGLLGEDSVYGGPTNTSATATEARGSYIVCTWIEGPSNGEVDATTTTPVSVQPAAPVPKPADLRFTGISVSRRHGANIDGTTAAKLAGRILVYASCDKSSSSSSVLVKKGKFAGHLKLPSACRGRRYTEIGAVWKGSPSFLKQSISKSVRIRK